MIDRTCPHCGNPVTRGPLAVYCSPQCKYAAAHDRADLNGSARAREAARQARKAAERDANRKPCPYCGTSMDGWRMQCGAAECKRRLVSERNAARQREYRERTGKWPSQRYRTPREHVCEACGEPFTSPDKATRFCSGACANSVRRWTRTCGMCGGQWEAKAPTDLFCSATCREVAGRAHRAQVMVRPGFRERRWMALAVVRSLRKRWYAGQCVRCGEWFVHDQPHTRTCSRRCAGKLSKARRRAVELEAFVEDVARWKIFERDGWRCQLCRKPVARTKSVPHPKAPVLDHIIPLAAGGTHEPSNVQCAHFLCNCLKGDRGGGEQLLLIG